MIVVGICQGLQPIIGYNYGAGRLDRLKRAYWLAVAWGTAVVSVGAIGGLTAAHWIARAFTIDQTLIDVTSRAFHHAFWAFWVVGFQIVSTTFFQSIGKAGKSIFLSLARQVIFLIPLLLILPSRMGLDGVWTSFPFSDLLATAATAIMIFWQFRQIERENPTRTS